MGHKATALSNSSEFKLLSSQVNVCYITVLIDHAPYFVVEFEDGISVVPAKKILEPPCASLRVENHCTVKWGKQKYCGVVRAMGKTLSITIIN